MPRKYALVCDSSVPPEIASQFPEHLEAGPVTLAAKIGEFVHFNPAYELVEDPDDYVLHVRAAKPAKPPAARAAR